ncbi:hypothetical protein [Kitasatospora sp. NPDC085879]
MTAVLAPLPPFDLDDHEDEPDDGAEPDNAGHDEPHDEPQDDGKPEPAV